MDSTPSMPFPFTSVLSLSLLVEYWEKSIHAGKVPFGEFLLEHIKAAPGLTQPGKIAIVYNQPKVEEEYKRYFQYLAGKNLISSDVEELELEELPGANGLKALRIETWKKKLFPR